MRRSLRRRPEPGNLDSFLDVMTNTVGVLIFVLLFVTLAAADATVLVRTPLRSETDKQPVFFEVSGGRVIHLELDEGNDEVASFLRGLPRFTWYNIDRVLARVDAFQTRTANYDVDLTAGFGVRWRARHGVGESIREVRKPSSEYRRVLRSFDPDTAYIAFIVRPDGVEVFRAVRDVAVKQGFESGWEPFEQSRDLIFSSSGRTVGVQ